MHEIVFRQIHFVHYGVNFVHSGLAIVMSCQVAPAAKTRLQSPEYVATRALAATRGRQDARGSPQANQVCTSSKASGLKNSKAS
jgi:hypothetical protein